MFTRGKYGRYLLRLMAVVDFMVVNAAMLCVMLLNPGISDLHSRLVWLLLNVAYIPGASYLAGAQNDRFVQMDAVMRTTLIAVGSHLLFFLTLLYLMDVESLPSAVIVEFYAIFLPALVAWRILARFLLKQYRRHGGNLRRVVIIGCGGTARRLYDELMSDTGYGVELQGFFDIYCPPDFNKKELYRGTLADLEDFVKTNKTE